MPAKEPTTVCAPRLIQAHNHAFALSLLAGLLGLFIALPLVGAEQEFAITGSVIAGGGGISAGSGFSVEGTIAQPASGTLLGDTFNLDAGFWHRVVDAIVEADPCAAPELRWFADGNGITFSWRAEPAGCVLEFSPSLPPPTSWSATTEIPTERDGSRFITFPTDQAVGFYRLRKPCAVE